MHGIVMKGFTDFVVEQYDRETWRTLLREADIDMTLYVPVTEYPDEDVLSLLDAAVELTGLERSTLLSEFGEFLVPPLIETYGTHVDEDWTGLELIANVETYIHEALRARDISSFTPPQLESEWIDDDSVLITYTSNRGLCDLAKGLVRGVGSYYDEQLVVEETACMHDGGPHCKLVVTRV